MLATEVLVPMRILHDVIDAKDATINASIVSRLAHQQKLADIHAGKISEDPDLHSAFRNGLASAVEANLRYGDWMLATIPKKAVHLYGKYVSATNKMHDVSREIAGDIPQGEDIDIHSEAVQKFLVKGAVFPQLYETAEKSLGKLSGSLWISDHLPSGRPGLTRRAPDEDLNLGEQARMIQSALRRERTIVVDEGYVPMDEQTGNMLVQQIAEKCNFDINDAKKVRGIMHQVGFFVQDDGVHKEVWFREASPIGWLHQLGVQEKNALAAFKFARSLHDSAVAYFALCSLQKIRGKQDAILEGIAQNYAGKIPHYPAEFLHQMGVAMYRAHKVG